MRRCLALIALTVACNDSDCPKFAFEEPKINVDLGATRSITLTLPDDLAQDLDLISEAPVGAAFEDGSTRLPAGTPAGDYAVLLDCATTGEATVQAGTQESQLPPCGNATVKVTCVDLGTVTTLTEPEPTGTAWEPTTVPSGQTDCAIDADGCLVDSGGGCGIELDEALTGDSATLVVSGTVEDGPAVTLIEAILFAYIDPYYGAAYGPGCRVDTDEATLVDDGFLFVASAPLPGPPGPRDVVITCEVDNAAGTAQMDVVLGDGQDVSFDGAGLVPSTDTTAFVGVRGGRVCGIEIQQ